MQLIIYGCGRFAAYAAYVFQLDSPYQIVAHCIEQKYLANAKADYPIIPLEELPNSFPPSTTAVFIALGNIKERKRLFHYFKEKGYTLASYCSSKADVWPNLQFGENVFIGEGSDLQPFIQLADNCILFGARLGHHCQIQAHTLLSGCTLAGNVTVGQGSFLGLQSAVQQNVQIGQYNIIGMGAIISQDTPDYAIYQAAPSQKRNLHSSKLKGFL
ncbi:acetyltransferase [Saprospira grandis]|uniref:Transferase hexapeptide repeat protein n=1 Tax=Saprospira grandis (strain Lewin) TaxID=984262 RepID=H6L428_SAPGL|nr:acetyltransferase [Saprospira grandis]AFC25012.1 transferase hexapeptide repeat protein [Saprospira grandis str. Lewin]